MSSGPGSGDWRASVRVALVHDWLNQMGGAENVLEEFVDLFPGAPVYTSMYGPDKMPETYRDWTIRTTFMQRLPLVTDHHQAYLPVYPWAFQRTDLSGFDLILSNKSGFCHGVRSRNGQRKALARLLLSNANPVSLAIRPVPPARADRRTPRPRPEAAASVCCRRWDYAAAQKVDSFHCDQHCCARAHPHYLRSRKRRRSPSRRYATILS